MYEKEIEKRMREGADLHEASREVFLDQVKASQKLVYKIKDLFDEHEVGPIAEILTLHSALYAYKCVNPEGYASVERILRESDADSTGH